MRSLYNTQLEPSTPIPRHPQHTPVVGKMHQLTRLWSSISVLSGDKQILHGTTNLLFHLLHSVLFPHTHARAHTHVKRVYLYWLTFQSFENETIIFDSPYLFIVSLTGGSPSSQRDSPRLKPHKSFLRHLYFSLQHGAVLNLEEKLNHIPQKSEPQRLPLHRQTRQLSADSFHFNTKNLRWFNSLFPLLNTPPAEAEPNPTPELGYPCCFPAWNAGEKHVCLARV